MFAEDAETACEALDLTLAGRDVGLKERIAMAWIPHHAADAYFAKLVQKGFNVAVMEGDEIKIYPEEDTRKEIEEIRKSDGNIDSDVPTVSRIVNEPQEQSTNLGERQKI